MAGQSISITLTPTVVMQADVIIVLGAAVKAGGVPSETLRRRVLHAIQLFRNGAASKLLMTGGVGQHPPSEAEIMSELAIRCGVPADRILTEPQGVSTLDSARKCAQILKGFGWRKALIVTDDYHLRRAVMVFRHFGIDAQGDGVAYDNQIPPWRYWFYRVREMVAFMWYRFLLYRHQNA